MKTRRPVPPLTLSGSLLVAGVALLTPVFDRATTDEPRQAPAQAVLPEESPAITGPVSTGGAAAPNVLPAPAPMIPLVPAAPGRTTPSAAASPAAAGMVVGLDPETGTWGPPTPEQLRELAELRTLSEGDARRVAKPEGPLPEVRHPDGHVSVELDGQFQEFTTVRIGPDGKPVFTCAHGPDEAARAIEAPAAPALEER
jgi:hypothetical protein